MQKRFSLIIFLLLNVFRGLFGSLFVDRRSYKKESGSSSWDLGVD